MTIHSDDELNAYICSEEYEHDLAATRDLWLRKPALGAVGMFIFLSYTTIPRLIGVHPVAFNDRVARMSAGLTNSREKKYLLDMFGLSRDHCSNGIADPRVRYKIRELTARHRRFEGMRPEYMDYIASIIAVSVLRLH